jgi:hypothetical protein
MSELPTFLREGVETDVIFFKEIITWIPTTFEQVFEISKECIYPYFKI